MGEVGYNGIPQALADIHCEVRSLLLRQPVDSESPVGANLHGHAQQPFDVLSDEIVFKMLKSSFGSGVVLSEESETRQFGNQPPKWRFVVDPVDGSDNRAKGLPLSAVSIAVLDPEGPLAPDRVRWAMVGGLDEEQSLVAGRELRSRRGDSSVSVSRVKALCDAFISCELNHFAPDQSLGSLLAKARGVRTYGCGSRALALVACGALDAHVDVRGRLTAESFLAAAFIVEQAGGCLIDLENGKFQHLTDLHSTARIVAAATPELAQEIVHELDNL